MKRMIIVFEDGETWSEVSPQHPPYVLRLTDEGYEKVFNGHWDPKDLKRVTDFEDGIIITPDTVYREIQRDRGFIPVTDFEV